MEGLLQFVIIAELDPIKGLEKRIVRAILAALRECLRNCTTWNPTNFEGESSIHFTFTKRDSFMHTTYLKGGGVEFNMLSKEVCSWRS